MAKFMLAVGLGLTLAGTMVSGTGAHAGGLEGKTLRICGGQHEWPPFYSAKREGGAATKEVVGLDMELLQKIAADNKATVNVELIAWKRCLASTQEGEYDALIGAGLNDDRRKNYLFTEGYYTLQPSYFFSKKHVPETLAVNAPNDLKQLDSLCGTVGFNYVNFGLKNEDVQMIAKDHTNLVEQTVDGACKISLDRGEIIEGWKSVGKNATLSDPSLVVKPVPTMPRETFHVLISKKSAAGEDFKKAFEETIAKMKSSGEFQKLLQKYGVNQ